ncbi:MAG TPA: DUF72 domain-containing protein [Thermoanaerobaculia bacterium]|jgi:uncharacterized protein YecE (DUF72 family)|nr:DUF72 domain-containing protein [Thermoanaerobaculia bacterium]
MSAKNAFTSPPRNHGFLALVFKRSCGGSYHAGERIRRVSEGRKQQLDLFGESPPPPPRPSSTEADRLAREHAEASVIAARLPAGVRFGTSSWSFPDWAGIVYSRVTKVTELAREGLREYALHPLLTTVGIDRSYYAPIPPQDLVRYSEQLPPAFPCCAKALELVTSAARPARSGGRPGEPNPEFLNARLFEDEMLGPFRDVFREHAGPFILQFPPAPRSLRMSAPEFAGKLERFLADLPKDFRYAIELRDPTFLTADYRDALAAHGAAHVYNYVTAMPMPAEQAKAIPVSSASFAVIRLLLRPGTTYGERREEMMPFSRLTDQNPEMREQVVSLARAATDAGIPVSVLVNNKAEGCSPLTIRALAEMLGSGV